MKESNKFENPDTRISALSMGSRVPSAHPTFCLGGWVRLHVVHPLSRLLEGDGISVS